MAFAVFATLSACQASVEGSVNTPKSEAEVPDFDKPLDTSAVEASRGPVSATPDAALIGARLDLSYNGSTTPRCKCLAVAVGQPTDPSFQWAGTRPTTDPNAQVVLAFTSAGVTCDASTDSAPASYWGYENVGSDVIVVVESAKPGRPVAQGAIIPRPAAGGQIYVRPVASGVPFGRPLSGTGDRCAVAALARPASAASSPAPASSSGWKSIKEQPSDPSSTKVDIP